MNINFKLITKKYLRWMIILYDGEYDVTGGCRFLDQNLSDYSSFRCVAFSQVPSVCVLVLPMSLCVCCVCESSLCV